MRCILWLLSLIMLAASAVQPFELPDAPDTMLVDCYCAVRGTDGGDTYHEFVLSTGADASCLILDEYRMEEGAAEEIHLRYCVPAAAAQACGRFIESAGFRAWDSLEDPVSLDGMLLVCKFYDQGTYIRVSSDEMPQDGERLLEGICQILQGYACDAYLSGTP